jgi:tetratricopeptide (TPR) repeat protein
VLTAKKDYSAALSALAESLNGAKEVKDTTRQAEVTWRLAQTQFAMGNSSDAAASAQAAVALAQSSRCPKLIYLTTTTLGQIYAAQNRTEQAIETLKRATTLLEQMRDQVAGSEVESQLFFEDKVAAYHSLLELLIKQKRPIDGLVYAERAKGRLLLDVLRGHRPNLSNLMSAAESI